MPLATSLFILTTTAGAAALVIGAGAAALRAGLPATRLARGVAAGLIAWLLLTALLAGSGLLSDFDARPPRLILLPLAALLTLGLLARTATFWRLARAAPLAWPLALQSFRVAVELGLWRLFLDGEVPVQMSFEGRNLDILVGLTAPVAALGAGRGWLPPRAVIAWNLGGLVLLFNIVGIAITSMPGPLHLDWPGVEPVVLTTVPFVWLPAVLVPLAVFGHLVSLGQLRGPAKR
jgi:hypothetical protein